MNRERRSIRRRLNDNDKSCTFLELSLSLHPPSPPRTAGVNQEENSGNDLLFPSLPVAIPPPFAWASNEPCRVLSLVEIAAKGIETITGLLQCKKCDHQCTMEFDLRSRFIKIGSFISNNKCVLHDRAPACWIRPELPSCANCDQPNCLKPMIAEDKKDINWLFLLLGEMLGCCTLEQLKFFCKHTGNHRTGAKDRLLYLTYLALCKQLDPTGPFDP